LDLLAAPRRENHLGVAARDLARIDNPIFREACRRQFREDRRAAGDCDELLDPSNAGDERLVPLLEEHAQPPWEMRRGIPNPIEIRRQPIREALGFLLTADQARSEERRVGKECKYRRAAYH